MTRKKTSPVPVEERRRVVLSVLSGHMTIAEAARRHGVADATVDAAGRPARPSACLPSAKAAHQKVL